MSVHIKTHEIRGVAVVMFVDVSRNTANIRDIKFPCVEETKGLIISAPSSSVPLHIAWRIIDHYKDRVLWCAVAEEQKNMAHVIASNTEAFVLGITMEVKFPCLKCLEQNRITWLKRGLAKYPYCHEHYNSAPHRY